MKDANMTVNDLHEIVLLGGFTKVPGLKNMLAELFRGKSVRKPENSNLLAAHGAALECGIVKDITGTEFANLL